MRRFYKLLGISKVATVKYLFIIGGQSNVGDAPATGRVSYSLMPSYLTTAQNVYQYNVGASTFDKYTHPNAIQWGWMNEFLYRVSLRLQDDIYFYKYGAGGTQLASGGPYGQYNKTKLKTEGLAAINRFKTLYPTGKVVFLWCHGYTDGLNATNATNYVANLAAFFAEVRSYWSLPSLLILYDKLSTNATGSTYRTDIRAGQTTVDGQLVGGQDRNVIVNADDCPYQDVAHYSDSGCVTLGQRFNTTLASLSP
jgi:hypothetical protein